MSVESRGEEPAVPIRHRLAVRPILVSSTVVPKFPQPLDENCNVVPENDESKQVKHEPRKGKRNRRKLNRQNIPKNDRHEPTGQKHDEHETEQAAVNSSKEDTVFSVQIPHGPVLEVPVGKSYYRVQHNGYKYSLLIEPTTGYLRHVHKRLI